MSSKIELKPVKDLLGKNFFIPNYQRGYKWKQKQVEDLLNDLDEFKINLENKEGICDDFYCMQPLAVRFDIQKTTDESIKIDNTFTEEAALAKVKIFFNKNVRWRVIDGQQRLTTMYLLLCYLDKSPYTIIYETRDESGDFLSKFKEPVDKNIENDSEKNVDFYHMYNVYKKIGEWFKDKDENYKTDFLNLLKEKVQFIWYETSEDEIEVFTRLNIGKIGLTNSELIKALILSQANFGSDGCVRQNEIANEWNDIEQSLQNDEFWYFIHDKDYNKPTRIDFLFDVLCELDIESKNKDEKKAHEAKIGTDKYRTFRHYDILLKEKKYETEKKKEYEVQWSRVKSLFEVLTEWYKDADFYHYIGYILCCKKGDIMTLYTQWNKNKDKDKFITFLKKEVSRCIIYKNLGQQYEIPTNANKDPIKKTACRPILLLHNIQTVINQNKQAESEDRFKIPVFYRFPFYLYKTEDWDVEHIDSNTTNDLKDNFSKLLWLLQFNDECEKRKEMIEDIIKHLTKNCEGDITTTIEEEEIKETIKSFSFTKFEAVSKDVMKYSTSPLDELEKNQIGNFTLLDSSTNRGYGNSIFPQKRLEIMAKDRCLKYQLCLKKYDNEWRFVDSVVPDSNNSAFIPPVTRNIFMKYYSPQTKNFLTWDGQDFDNYIDDIRKVLGEFLDDNDNNSSNK